MLAMFAGAASGSLDTGHVSGILVADETCGAAAVHPCASVKRRVGGWRLRFVRLTGVPGETTTATAPDGSFDLRLGPGEYSLMSAESPLVGLIPPLTVKIDSGQRIRLDLTVQLLRP